MSPTRSGYKELGLELVEPLQDQPCQSRRPPMVDEKKDEGAGDPIKILLEETLERQRNAMMDSFAQILQRLPRGNTSTSNSYSGNATPFKVQVNFEIPIFEGQIDANAIDKWLNMLEGYFLFMIFLVGKRLFSLFSKQPPTLRTGGKTSVSRRMKVRAHYFPLHPLGIPSGMPSRTNTTLSKAMRTNT